MKNDALQAEGLLELILNSLGEGVVVADRDGKFLFFNPTAEKIVGRGAVERFPESWSEVYGIYYTDRTTMVPTDDVPLARAIRGESFDAMEVFIRNPNIPNGVFLSVTGRPLQNRNGELIGGVVVFHHKEDTSHILFELAKQDDADLQSALRRITEADARRLQVERVSVWLFNVDHTEIVCENLFCLTPGRHERGARLAASRAPRYFQALEGSRFIDARDAQQDPRTNEFAEDYLRPLGITSMMDVPVRLHGKVVGVVCHEHIGPQKMWGLAEQMFASSIADLVSIALEAEERRRAEIENLKSLSLLRAALEATADALLVVDLTGRMVSFNQKFVEMWRIPEDIIQSADDRRALDFVLDQLYQPEIFLQKVKQLYGQVESESLDEVLFKDGRIFERYSKPQRLGDQIVGRVWSFRDVTVERRAYNEMKKVNQFKTNLASIISHELRTPLAVIQESLGVVLDGLDGPVEDAQKKTLVIAKNSAEWLGRLINNFLNFTRIEAGRMALERKRHDARSLIDEACRLMKAFAERKGIALAKFLPQDPVDVLWDADQVKAAVINLIDNAIKYTEAPGYIWVRLKDLEDKVWIEVEDTGIGIREDDHSLIFDLFAQAADRPPWKTGGFGIGLAICKYVAERHGGRLELESQYGKGSLFRVEIPKT